MTLTKTDPSPLEITFPFEELFFSRTDERGILVFGNAVFQRVSIYSWQELLGQPHKIVRHPDMPRGVFHLFWQTLKQNRPVGAYVKNRAKDGRFYWVYAVAAPVDGGFRSVRLRPSSPLFAAIQADYQTLLAEEKDLQRTPAESAGRLEELLQARGFRDYGSFMAAALSQELQARDRQIEQQDGQRLSAFDELVTEGSDLLTQAAMIGAAYERNAYVPLNFQILAAQLGPHGAAVGVVSSNYDLISSEIRANLQRFSASAHDLFQVINEGLFLIGAARLQSELAAQLKLETAGDRAALDAEMVLLEAQTVAFNEKARAGLELIAAQTARFRHDCSELGRLATGLEVTRIMGKVECARHVGANEGLNELVGELETFQKLLARGLRDINLKNQHIQRQTGKILSELCLAA